MKKYFFIASGGFTGAILRYLSGKIDFNDIHHLDFPWNTFLVNITGAFLLSLFIETTSSELYNLKINSNIKLGITAGLLGAFTTFSTLCKESVRYIYNGHFFTAAFYAIISAVAGLLFVYLGFIAAPLLAKYIKRLSPATRVRIIK